MHVFSDLLNAQRSEKLYYVEIFGWIGYIPPPKSAIFLQEYVSVSTNALCIVERSWTELLQAPERLWKHNNLCHPECFQCSGTQLKLAFTAFCHLGAAETLVSTPLPYYFSELISKHLLIYTFSGHEATLEFLWSHVSGIMKLRFRLVHVYSLRNHKILQTRLQWWYDNNAWEIEQHAKACLCISSVHLNEKCGWQMSRCKGTWQRNWLY